VSEPLAEIAVKTLDLVEWYSRPGAAMLPGRSGPSGARTFPGPRMPLRVGVLDTKVKLGRDTLRWEDALRAADQDEPTPNRNPARSLAWCAERLSKWPESNRPEWFEEIVTEIKGHHSHIEVVIGNRPEPLRTGLRCPFCASQLIIKLDQGLILCRDHGCRCAAEDCPCFRGKGHSWDKAEWPRLGLLLDTPKE